MGDFILQVYDAASSVITNQHFDETNCQLFEVSKTLQLIAMLLKH
jgi:hypothetical protein